LAGTIPDPNSASIQQVVQNYNVSVQFKQRPKTYCTTTCTVRGSNDNMSGLVVSLAADVVAARVDVLISILLQADQWQRVGVCVFFK